jgi:hypothetical protein
VFGVLLVDSEDERVRASRVAALLFLMRVAIASCIFLASWVHSFFFHHSSSRLGSCARICVIFYFICDILLTTLLNGREYRDGKEDGDGVIDWGRSANCDEGNSRRDDEMTENGHG